MNPEKHQQHQSETKDMIKRDTWIKGDNTKYKRGVEQRYGKPQKKKNQTEILEIKSPFSQTKNTVEGHSSKQMGVRISELEIK
jgi:hypothetical protein